MKYLKLYESRKKITLQEYLERHYLLEKEKFIKIDVSYHKFLSLKGIENCISLIQFICRGCDLKNLKGIENCDRLEYIDCRKNLLKNLDELNNLPKLEKIYAFENDWEYPLPEKLAKKCVQLPYSLGNISNFSSYESQKKLMQEHPERIEELKELDINLHEKIKEEFPDLVEGSEFGFFGLKN